MTPVAGPLNLDLDGSSSTLVLRIQQALASAGFLDGVSVYLKARNGSMVPVIEDGERARLVADPYAGLLCGEGSTLCLDLEGGEQVFVRDRNQGLATVKLVSVVLRSSLQVLESEQREARLLEELGSSWESLEALYEISTDALRFGDIRDALMRLIKRLTTLQDGLHSALFIRRGSTFHPLVCTTRDPMTLTYAQLGRVEETVREMRVILLNEILETLDADTCWSKASSLAAAPFSWPGCVGFVVVWCEQQNIRFDSSFSRVLEAITYQASVMLESDRLNRKLRENELLAQEVQIASSIQQTLLLANAPKSVPNLEIASCSIPSQQIDGDFHDFFQHPNGTVDVLIGDVMGKGVAAALLGAATKSQFLRATANLALRSNTAPRPADIVSRAASRLSDRLISLDRFVTLCYARFDRATQCLVFVDCGHTSMIRESKSEGVCGFLGGQDLPLGVLPGHQCEEHSTKFFPGETYLLYSDGVTENRSPEGELFGPERLAECVQNWASLGPTSLVEQIRREAVRFKQSENFSDDFTCIAVRVKLRQSGVEPLYIRSASFGCTSQSLPSFRAWLSECAALTENCLAEEDVARLHLACSEVFANCATHVPNAQCETPLQVESRVFANHVTVQISQRGPVFDPLAIPLPSFDGSRDSGFGVYIVLLSSDEAHFARQPDGINLTTLSFARSMRDQRP